MKALRAQVSEAYPVFSTALTLFPAAMWDCHFRVGGAYGTNLELANCPILSDKAACMAASMLMHVTAKASGYFENVWLWTADHDLDAANANSTNATATEISVFTGRGLLVESQGPSWFVGTAVEHSQIYQYQLYNAQDIYLGHMQTETPYYQPSPGALQPYTVGSFPADPDFADCEIGSPCEMAWALRVIQSTDIFIYSAGLYSFFSNYNTSCNAVESCQLSLVQTSYTQGLWLFNLFTKGAVEMISILGLVDLGIGSSRVYTDKFIGEPSPSYKRTTRGNSNPQFLVIQVYFY